MISKRQKIVSYCRKGNPVLRKEVEIASLSAKFPALPFPWVQNPGKVLFLPGREGIKKQIDTLSAYVNVYEELRCYSEAINKLNK